MDFLITHEGGMPFKFPSEIITGYNPALHPESELEQHIREVAEARREAAEWNKQYAPKTKNTKHQQKT